MGADGIAALDEIPTTGNNYRAPRLGIRSTPFERNWFNSTLTRVSRQLQLVSISSFATISHVLTMICLLYRDLGDVGDCGVGSGISEDGFSIIAKDKI